MTVRYGAFAVARIGLCSPKHCSNEQSYSSIMDLILNMVPMVEGNEDTAVSVTFENVKEINQQNPGAGFWIFMSVVMILVLFGVLGVFVQKTSLFDLKNLTEQEKTEGKVEHKKSKLGLLFYSFSPAANLEKIFTVKEGGDQTLTVLNGVRVFSIMWVAVGHTFSFIAFGPIHNYQTADSLLSGHSVGVIAGGIYAVDSFFFLSGFLTCYLLSSKAYPKGGKINWLLVYFHRYYRLIFPVLFIMFFAMYVFPFMGSGPAFRSEMGSLFDNCNSYWWSNLLFINNFIPFGMNDQCIGWVWYLANDFQFFLMTPPIIYAYCKNRKVGYLLMVLLILVSSIINGTLTAIFDVSVAWGGAQDFMAGDWMYSKPWSRMGAYFVGGIFGLGYFEYACKAKHPELSNSFSNKVHKTLQVSQIKSLIMCIVGIAFTAILVLPLRNFLIDCGQEVNCWSRGVSTVHNIFNRSMFVFGLGLIILPTFVGRLRLVRNILGSEPFAVLARLNYMVYMVHCLVIFWYLLDSKQSIYANELNLWFMSIGAIVVSFLFAIPATLLFEAPFMNIEKYLLFPAKRERTFKVHASINGTVDESTKGTKYFALNDDTAENTSKLLE